MSEWNEYKFSELCSIKRGGSPRPINDFLSDSGIPWVKIADATSSDSRHIYATNQFIKVDGKTKSREVIPGDLILSNSATPGIPRFMQISACIHDGWLLLRDFNNIDKEFCFYLLVYERPKLVAQGNGSIFTNLKTDILKSHIVKIPSLAEQKAIAHILSTLDDKIALNRKLNATLEAMAQALFQSWFVDFDPVKAKLAAVRCGRDPEQAAMAAIACKLVVPPGKPKAETLDAQLPSAEAIDAAIAALDELSEAQRQSLKEKAAHFPADFQESELGLIPQGWRVLRADQVVDISIGKTPPRKESQWFTRDPENVRWVSIKDMGGLQTYSTESSEYLTQEAVEKFNIKVIPKNSILLSFKLTVGRVAICDAPTATNEAIAHLIPQGPDCPLSTAYVYCYFKQFDYDMLASTSSIANAVNSKTVKAIPVIAPNPNSVFLRAFREDTTQLFEMIKNLNFQSRTLANLRDALLPKLLSGEISVSPN